MKTYFKILFCFSLFAISACKKQESIDLSNVFDYKVSGFPSDVIISAPNNNLLLINYKYGKIQMVNNSGEVLWFKDNCFNGFNPNTLNLPLVPIKFGFNEASELCSIETIKDTSDTSQIKYTLELKRYSINGTNYLKKNVPISNDSNEIKIFDLLSIGSQTLIAFNQNNSILVKKLDANGNEDWTQSVFLNTIGARLALLNSTTFLLIRDKQPELLIEQRDLSNGTFLSDDLFNKILYNSDGSNTSEYFGFSDIQSRFFITDNSILFSGFRDHKINNNEIFARTFVSRIDMLNKTIISNYFDDLADIESFNMNASIDLKGNFNLLGFLYENSTNFYPVIYSYEEIVGTNSISIKESKLKSLNNSFPLCLAFNNDNTATIVGKKGRMPEYINLPYVLKPKFYSQQTFFIRTKI